MSELITHKFNEKDNYSIGLKFSFSHENGVDVSKELHDTLIEDEQDLFIGESKERVIAEIQNGRYETGENDEFTLKITPKNIHDEKEIEEISVNVEWEVLKSSGGFAAARFDVVFDEFLDVEKAIDININFRVDTTDEDLEEKELEINEEEALKHIQDSMFYDVENNRSRGFESFKYEGVDYSLTWYI